MENVPANQRGSRPDAGLIRRVAHSWLALVACVGFALSCPGFALAQVDVINREYPIKAAYLYNFANFVEWPAEAFEDPTSPVVIGVLGPDPFGRLLDQVAGKQVAGRRVLIRRYAKAADVGHCHLLFIGSAVAAEEVAAIESRFSKAPVLLVGERPGFAENVGIIGFRVELNKVRFEINPNAAKARGLKISSKLLSLATIVGGA